MGPREESFKLPLLLYQSLELWSYTKKPAPGATSLCGRPLGEVVGLPGRHQKKMQFNAWSRCWSIVWRKKKEADAGHRRRGATGSPSPCTAVGHGIRRDYIRPPWLCVAAGRYEQRHSLNREALAPVRKAGRSRVSRVANMDGDTVLALIDTHVFKCGWFISCTSVHDFDCIYSSSLLLLFMCQLIILNGPSLSLLIDADSDDESYWLLMCLMIARVSPVAIVLIVWVTGFVWLDIGYAIAYLHWWSCTCVEFYDDCFNCMSFHFSTRLRTWILWLLFWYFLWLHN